MASDYYLIVDGIAGETEAASRPAEVQAGDSLSRSLTPVYSIQIDGRTATVGDLDSVSEPAPDAAVNTNDLRGKVLRIRVNEDGSY
jgi:hypothetical protein